MKASLVRHREVLGIDFREAPVPNLHEVLAP